MKHVLTAQTSAAASRATVTTAGRWLGDPGRPLLGWLTTPAAGPTSAGVLVLPDVGAQYWSSHHTLRAIAERLAAGGHTVLRLDYDGTGDSSGDQWDPDRLSAWRASAAAGADELRALGCDRLTVIGVRLGAMLALADGAALGADEVVAWAPESTGKRYTRAIRLLGEPIPDEAGLTSGGVVFTNDTLAELATLDLTRVERSPAPRTLLLGDIAKKVADHLQSLGGEVQLADPGGSEVALDRSAEDAEVAQPVAEAIAAFVASPAPAPAPAPGPARPAARSPSEQRDTSAHIPWDGRHLTERIITINNLIGVLTEPEAPARNAATVVFLNAGSSSHVGPGRIWVEYARSLAAAGHRVLRVDWRGWGESPDDGHAPGRPYDRHTHDETIDLVHALRADGHERIVLSGLCASAWMALRVAREAPVAGVIAFNPQLYWEWGDPVLSQPDTVVWRTDVREREERLARYGLWTALDALGQRPPVARWLEQLSSAQRHVLLLFSEADAGLGYLRTRLGRRLQRLERAGYARAEEIDGIDHGMLRAWRRPDMIRAMLAHLDRID